MYLFIGLFSAAVLLGILFRKFTAPKTQSIGLSSAALPHE
jgi:hypothetical protein